MKIVATWMNKEGQEEAIQKQTNTNYYHPHNYQNHRYHNHHHHHHHHHQTTTSTTLTSVSAAKCMVSVTSRPVTLLRMSMLWLTTVLSGSQNLQTRRRTERSHWLKISTPSRGDTKWGLVITSGGVGSTEMKRYEWYWQKECCCLSYTKKL